MRNIIALMRGQFLPARNRKDRVEGLVIRLGVLTVLGIIASFAHIFMIVTLFSSSGAMSMIIVALFVFALDFSIGLFTDYIVHCKSEDKHIPWYQWGAFWFGIILSFVLNAIYFTIHAPFAIITNVVQNPMIGYSIGILAALMLAALIPVLIAVAPAMKASLEVELSTGIDTTDVNSTKDELIKRLSANAKLTQNDIYQIVGGNRNQVCARIKELREEE